MPRSQDKRSLMVPARVAMELQHELTVRQTQCKVLRSALSAGVNDSAAIVPQDSPPRGTPSAAPHAPEQKRHGRHASKRRRSPAQLVPSEVVIHLTSELVKVESEYEALATMLNARSMEYDAKVTQAICSGTGIIGELNETDKRCQAGGNDDRQALKHQAQPEPEAQLEQRISNVTHIKSGQCYSMREGVHKRDSEHQSISGGETNNGHPEIDLTVVQASHEARTHATATHSSGREYIERDQHQNLDRQLGLAEDTSGAGHEITGGTDVKGTSASNEDYWSNTHSIPSTNEVPPDTEHDFSDLHDSECVHQCDVDSTMEDSIELSKGSACSRTVSCSADSQRAFGAFARLFSQFALLDALIADEVDTDISIREYEQLSEKERKEYDCETEQLEIQVKVHTAELDHARMQCGTDTRCLDEEGLMHLNNCAGTVATLREKLQSRHPQASKVSLTTKPSTRRRRKAKRANNRNAYLTKLYQMHESKLRRLDNARVSIAAREDRQRSPPSGTTASLERLKALHQTHATSQRKREEHKQKVMRKQMSKESEACRTWAQRSERTATRKHDRHYSLPRALCTNDMSYLYLGINGDARPSLSDLKFICQVEAAERMLQWHSEKKSSLIRKRKQLKKEKRKENRSTPQLCAKSKQLVKTRTLEHILLWEDQRKASLQQRRCAAQADEVSGINFVPELSKSFLAEMKVLDFDCSPRNRYLEPTQSSALSHSPRVFDQNQNDWVHTDVSPVLKLSFCKKMERQGEDPRSQSHLNDESSPHFARPTESFKLRGSCNAEKLNHESSSPTLDRSFSSKSSQGAGKARYRQDTMSSKQRRGGTKTAERTRSTLTKNSKCLHNSFANKLYSAYPRQPRDVHKELYAAGRRKTTERATRCQDEKSAVTAVEVLTSCPELKKRYMVQPRESTGSQIYRSSKVALDVGGNFVRHYYDRTASQGNNLYRVNHCCVLFYSIQGSYQQIAISDQPMIPSMPDLVTTSTPGPNHTVVQPTALTKPPPTALVADRLLRQQLHSLQKMLQDAPGERR